MKNFDQKDIQQLKSHGLSVEKVQNQLETFEKGIPFTEITAPANLGNLLADKAGGIKKLSEGELKTYAKKYDEQNLNVVKFVPASGAATRMFQFLQVFQSDDLQGFQNPALPAGRLAGLKKPEEQRPLHGFFDRLPDFPFYKALLFETKKSYPNFEEFPETERKYALLKTLLDKYSTLPKGLVPFHKYPAETRTAFEEHFFEAQAYAEKNHRAKLHFTVSEEHLEKFRLEEKKMEKTFPVDFQVSYSFQQKSTDTIAVDMQNRPFRDEFGNLVFRPSGHGALLENLNKIDADIVFIKNIDNVSTEENLPLISLYKKVLAGILLEIQEEVFQHLNNLQTLPTGRQGFKNFVGLEEAKDFLKVKFNIEVESFQEIKNYLNRPIRVCGMVKNTGAPGGGPFWAKDGNGKTSLQIVETAQIDLENPQQKEILENATHFNPVDLVCGTRNYKGKKFDLMEFSNSQRGFISKKSLNGRDLQALELPGLWNGAMEHWNTVFVEVPQETFNPVKTVMDLLKPGHRGGN